MAALACGISDRGDLVGRYVAEQEGRRETWSLADDGTCAIARPDGAGGEALTRCEWEVVERHGRRTLAVTLLPDDRDILRHRTRLVLTPTRLPGGAVTIPLGRGRADLRKVE